MRRNLHFSLIGTVLAAILVAGCQAPAQPTGPTRTTMTADSPEQLDRVWTAAEDTLLAHYFEIDRKDRQAGILTTVPTTSANWFELWQPQPEPAYYWAESNTHTIQRQVTIRITPAGGDAYEIDVQVDRYRYSLEERQVDNAAAVMRLYSSEAPTLTGRQKTTRESSRWIRLGRDELMERTIGEEILRRCGAL